MFHLIRYLGGAGILALIVIAAVACGASSSAGPEARATSGFDEFGYNNSARIFHGIADGLDRNFDGMVYFFDTVHANDLETMKWNAEWDRGTADGWSDGPYAGAWLIVEHNGNVEGGSGHSWHYKSIWIGPEGENSPYWRDGGFLLGPPWDPQWEMIMDQGDYGEHYWAAHAIANGLCGVK